jgi:transposase
MRADDVTQDVLFSFLDVGKRIPARHPIRGVRNAAAEVLAELRPRIDQVYAKHSRAGLPPEKVLRALAIWGLYGVASERRLLEELEYNLLYRWFVGFTPDEKVWSRAAFRDHRRRLHDAGMVAEFLARLFARSKGRVLANPHFTVNRALVEAWCGQQSIPGW